MAAKGKKHVIQIASGNGHDEVAWVETDEIQISTAAAEFERLIQEHYQVYAFKDGGHEGGEIAKTFDPTVEKYMAFPRAAGG